MDLRAEIRTYGAPCEERHKLGVAVTDAIANVYECRRRWDAVQKQDPHRIAQAASALQAARAALQAARRDYDQHLLDHRCLGSARAAAASAT
jgi:hypothetical protein